MPQAYDDKFFSHHHDGSVNSARVIVPILRELVRFSSVVDVGCGTGTWLSVFAQTGTSDFLGIDGSWVDPAKLVIPAERFGAADLARPPKVGRRFDLAVSVEVAEHLPESSAAPFINWLTELAPVVAFSAAIPNQGGTSHVNEQWPDYWARLFEERGFACIDAIRRRIWADQRVQWWYSQNILVYAELATIGDQPRLAELAALGAHDAAARVPLRLVHPGCFETALRQPVPLRRIVREAPRALRRAIKSTLRRS